MRSFEQVTEEVSSTPRTEVFDILGLRRHVVGRKVYTRAYAFFGLNQYTPIFFWIDQALRNPR